MNFKIMTTVGLLTFSTATLADHNSPMGEGWANMPNDVHNTRVETRESGDNEAFKDFVQYGNGASTVNRFTDTSTSIDSASTTSRSQARTERSQSGGSKGRH